MAKKRRSYPKSANKWKFDFKPRDNTILEDNSSPNVKVKIISDPKEPFYKHIFNKGSEKDGTSNN